MNLQNLNVAELNAQEIENTDGGYWGYALAIGLYVLSEWDDISAGYRAGSAGKSYNY